MDKGRIANLLYAAAIASLFFVTGARAGKIVDFITGQEVGREELEQTKNLGYLVVSPITIEKQDMLTLRDGDRILAADGIRFFGCGELNVIREKVTDRNDFDLVICRDGKVQECRITGLFQRYNVYDPRPHRQLEMFRRVQRGEFLQLADELNLPLSRRERESLDYFPPRATAMLRKWVNENPSGKQNLEWLKKIVSLYVCMVNSEFDSAEPPQIQSPVEFFNRLAKFYMKIANRNRSIEKTPDWKSSGEGIDFYSVYYPLPRTSTPEIGKVETSDPRFNRLLKALIEDPLGSITERRKVRVEYIKAGTQEDLKSFLGHVKALILCYDGYVPLETVSLFFQPGSYYAKPEIVKMLDEYKLNDNDKILVLFGKLLFARHQDDVIELSNEIFSISPYLAVFGQRTTVGHPGGHCNDYYMKWYKKHGLRRDLTVSPSVFYDWVVNKWEGTPSSTTPIQPLVYIEYEGRIHGFDEYLACHPLVIKNAFGEMAPDLKLIDGIRNDDIGRVEEAFREGASVKTASYMGLTVMEVAALDASVHILKCLVEHGADPDEVTSQGVHPFVTVAGKGKLGSVVFLAGRIKDINVRNNRGANALESAAIYNRIAVMQFLLDKGMKVNSAREDGKTILMKTVSCGSNVKEAVEFLLKQGADINARDKNGESVLLCAMRTLTEDQSVLKLLLDKGVKYSEKELEDALEAEPTGGLGIYKKSYNFVKSYNKTGNVDNAGINQQK